MVNFVNLETFNSLVEGLDSSGGGGAAGGGVATSGGVATGGVVAAGGGDGIATGRGEQAEEGRDMDVCGDSQGGGLSDLTFSGSF